MDIKITGRAEAELSKFEPTTLRIIFDDDCGCQTIAYNLVQDEPRDGDAITTVGDRTFVAQNEIAKAVSFFEIDFYKGLFRKAFVIFPNGYRN